MCNVKNKFSHNGLLANSLLLGEVILIFFDLLLQILLKVLVIFCRR